MIIGEGTFLLGDCLDVMRGLPDASVDAVVTDPPYELGFMGKGWDASGAANDPDIWRQCLRVLKPGGHLLSFGGSRTYHRMACAVEDAGFEIRDQIMWIYGSGFPKSLDVAKAIDAAAGTQGSVIASGAPQKRLIPGAQQNATGSWIKTDDRQYQPGEYRPATPDAAQWQGWGTALKPAHEPIVLARKPLMGTVAANVLAHGVGALNIDASRVPTDEPLGGGAQKQTTRDQKGNEGWERPWMDDPVARAAHADRVSANVAKAEVLGRWPANVIHDGSDEVLDAFPTAPGQIARASTSDTQRADQNTYGTMRRGSCGPAPRGDTGSAARFFYCPKASKSDRGEGNTHPTVKPTALIEYLLRMVVPEGALVLDPFAGSGTTAIAAQRTGRRWICIEKDPDYYTAATTRAMLEVLDP